VGGFDCAIAVVVMIVSAESISSDLVAILASRWFGRLLESFRTSDDAARRDT
jgi:hypothetical protein